MSKADLPITTLTNLRINPDPKNIKNGLFHLPQYTTAQMNAIPADYRRNGAMLYDTTTDEFMIFKDGAWVAVTTA